MATWPASPEDASSPLKATSTSGKAKRRSCMDGVPAIEPGSVSTSGVNRKIRPKATIRSWSARSPSTRNTAR
jgi:hypothetical protein